MKLIMESWRRYLREGKAIEINASMRRWADKAADAYMSAAKKEQLKYDMPFYSGTVDGYDNEKIEVKVIIVKAPNPRYNRMGAVDGKTLGTNKQTIKLFQTKDPKEGVLNWAAWNFKQLILHELIHVVDPKFKLDPKKHTWNKVHRDPVKYYNSPHEQDAFMRQTVEDIKSWIGPITKEMVKNYKPERSRPWEKVWYKTNPKAWRKLLLTLYAAVDQDNPQDP